MPLQQWMSVYEISSAVSTCCLIIRIKCVVLKLLKSMYLLLKETINGLPNICK